MNKIATNLNNVFLLKNQYPSVTIRLETGFFCFYSNEIIFQDMIIIITKIKTNLIIKYNLNYLLYETRIKVI